MKLCETCIYRNEDEYHKPCIVYRDDCEYYEKERGDMSGDLISRQEVLNEFYDVENLYERIKQLPSVNPQEPKAGHCKDCKWWKDSDGVFRRGIGAESQCPMNRIEVYEGNGYCYMFEPQERSE